MRITSGLLIRKIPAGVQNAPHFRLTFSFRFQRDTPVSGVGTGSLLSPVRVMGNKGCFCLFMDRGLPVQPGEGMLARAYPSARSRIIMETKPQRNPVVTAPSKPCRWHSGITSSTTTKIIAPAAKASA